jgi:peptidoglycan hydrolase-like protein with peptidoglycan-binding domain
MDSRFGITIATVLIGTALSVSVQPAWAVRSQDYAPEQFISVLNGFGYPVSLSAPLSDPIVQQAIRDFQAQNRLPIDGTLNPPTQDKAADLVRQLQNSLNRVVQPSPQLPRSQFYGKQTESVVRLFQRQNGLPETGIATFETRQRISDILNDATPRDPATPPRTPTTPPTSSIPLGNLYNETEFRLVLRGLGYDINPQRPLTDSPAVLAIRDFQQRYGLSVNGGADQPTQEKAAAIVRNLRFSLRVVLKRDLPVDRYYDTPTQDAVRAFQSQFGLGVDGTATVSVRRRLDAEAKRVGG